MKAIYKVIKSKDMWHCDFCPIFPDEANGIYEISARSLETNRPISCDFACEDCHQKYQDGLIPKCSECDKLFGRKDEVCFYCNVYKPKYKEELENEPREINDIIQLEKQIHELSLENKQLTEDIEIHLDAIGTAERFGEEKEKDRQRRLSDENRKLKAQVEELRKQVNNLHLENGTLKTELNVLKFDILQLSNKVEIGEAQIEQPPK